jgi:hypothetical protein
VRRLYGWRAPPPGRAVAAAGVALLLACAGPTAAEDAPAGAGGGITAFSSGKPGTALPTPWTSFKINDRKIPTRYELVDDGGTVVLKAHAERSASGIGHGAPPAWESLPVIEWRWKIAAPLVDADPADGAKEDAPVRVLLEFDGDHSKLPLRERTVDSVAEQLAGRPLPYATLMYIHAANVPVGTIVPNPHTKRIQMFVVASGKTAVGTWQTVTRNWRDDYQKAFGQAPGTLLKVGVMTDTDNTGETADAWYGDIRMMPKP